MLDIAYRDAGTLLADLRASGQTSARADRPRGLRGRRFARGAARERSRRRRLSKWSTGTRGKRRAADANQSAFQDILEARIPLWYFQAHALETPRSPDLMRNLLAYPREARFAALARCLRSAPGGAGEGVLRAAGARLECCAIGVGLCAARGDYEAGAAVRGAREVLALRRGATAGARRCAEEALRAARRERRTRDRTSSRRNRRHATSCKQARSSATRTCGIDSQPWPARRRCLRLGARASPGTSRRRRRRWRRRSTGCTRW